MKAAFWNVHGAVRAEDCVAALLDAERPDFVGLAECSAAFDPRVLPAGYSHAKLSSRLAVLSRTPLRIVRPVGRLGRFAQLVEVQGWRIVVCHLKSGTNDGGAERDRLLIQLGAFLQGAAIPRRRLVVLGDLNINPWEPGLVNKVSLHGLQTRDEAWKGLDYDAEHFPALLNVSYQLARPFPSGGGEVWGTYRH